MGEKDTLGAVRLGLLIPASREFLVTEKREHGVACTPVSEVIDTDRDPQVDVCARESTCLFAGSLASRG